MVRTRVRARTGGSGGRRVWGDAGKSAFDGGKVRMCRFFTYFSGVTAVFTPDYGQRFVSENVRECESGHF